MMSLIRHSNARACDAAHAAPTGGAHLWWGRGCGFAGLAFIAMLWTTQGAAQIGETIEVSSGQPVTLSEILLDTDPGALWVRFRFVAPRIREGAGAVSYDVTALDMDFLCNDLALPWLDERAVTAERIVISFSDQPTVLGQSDPMITQFFEFYRSENGACIWEEH